MSLFLDFSFLFDWCHWFCLDSLSGQVASQGQRKWPITLTFCSGPVLFAGDDQETYQSGEEFKKEKHDENDSSWVIVMVIENVQLCPPLLDRPFWQRFGSSRRFGVLWADVLLTVVRPMDGWAVTFVWIVYGSFFINERTLQGRFFVILLKVCCLILELKWYSGKHFWSYLQKCIRNIIPIYTHNYCVHKTFTLRRNFRIDLAWQTFDKILRFSW